jgi:DNA primase
MTDNWVDFRSVNSQVTMSMVLEHYGINGLRKEKSGELVGRCPIHKGEGERSFHVSLSKNCFQCFSCKKRGNVLDLAAALDHSSVRDAALKLASVFGVESTEMREQKRMRRPEVQLPTPQLNDSTEKEVTNGCDPLRRSELRNEPLSFTLKGIDHSHRYLTERGIEPGTAEAFGIGYFSGKGSMSGRIVIPIHNGLGELVGYAGRSLDGEDPRYKFPAGFHKSIELYNLHRIAGKTDQVILVEGFFSVMKLWQADFASVALMGSSLSEEQEELLAAHFKVVVLLFDGDEAGKQCTDECLVRLGRRMWTRAVVLEQGRQPDLLCTEELRDQLRL